MKWSMTKALLKYSLRLDFWTELVIFEVIPRSEMLFKSEEQEAFYLCRSRYNEAQLIFLVSSTTSAKTENNFKNRSARSAIARLAFGAVNCGLQTSVLRHERHAFLFHKNNFPSKDRRKICNCSSFCLLHCFIIQNT